jgi:Putative Ig domain
MKPFLGVLSVIFLAILQPQLLEGQGAALFQTDCASCHALPGSGSGPALSSSVGLRRGGWEPLVVAMDQDAGYTFTSDVAAIGAYLDSLYPIANPAALPVGAVGSTYGPTALSGRGGTAPYSFSATGLPNSLNVSLSGSLAGTPGPGTQGTYTALFTVTDSTSSCVAPFSTCPYSGTFTRTVTIGPAVNITGPSTLPGGKIAVPYGPVTFTAIGGVGSYTWSATGLPPGIGIDPSTGTLAGTPTTSGVFNPQFSVHDSASGTFTGSLPLFIASGSGIVSPLVLSAGIAGVAYGPVTFQAAGGTGPYTWSATGLPPGMGIDPSTGALGGAPTLPGSFNPQFTAKDSTNATFVINLSLAITPSAGCNYALSAGGQVFPVAGGSGSFGVTAQPGCGWSVSGAPAWITLTSPMSSSGNGTISYQVAAGTGTAQTATFTVAGISFTVEQQGNIAGLNPIGSLAHLLAEENWTTTLTLVNKGATPAQARTSIFGDPVDAGGTGPLLLPLLFPQQQALSGPLLAASFDQALAPNASLIVGTAGPQTPPVLVGSMQLAGTGPVDGFAIFHQNLTTQEAVVPLETRNASSYLLAYDNTGGVVLGVAVQNVSAQNAVIPVIIRDDTGVVISAPGATISLAGSSHTSFVLSDPAVGFPVTANGRGTIEFDTPAGGQISVLGLRFTPPNNALTTIPALANVGTGGGSIAHIATGGDGWQTTFVLVNTGSTAAQMTLNIFNDETGTPLSIPLSFPQPGGGANTFGFTVPRTLAAGATLVIVSGGTSRLFTGSAQLTTTGNVSGFVIFRHNNQEAVVPLESRNANGYIIAFDNTGGTATGIAVNAVSAGSVSVPVKVRDDTGALILSDTLNLAPNGHLAFTLATDKYPETANIRGTIEFDKPANAQIGALGIRMPTGAAHAYTTLPALAK